MVSTVAAPATAGHLTTSASREGRAVPTASLHSGSMPSNAPILPSVRPAAPRAGSGSTLAWTNITGESPTAPGPFWFTEGTWDAADHSLVTYGGDNFVGTNLQTTQSYANGDWSTVSTTGVNPGPLDGPSLAYDPNASAVVMYGGVASYSPFSSTNLTFFYSGGVWSSSHLVPTPPQRLAGSMVYDPALGGVVLFGGYNNSDTSGTTLLNDLWLYKAGAWSLLSGTGAPSNRTWSAFGYDPNLHELVLFGGLDAAGGCLGDTWTYDGGWTHVAVSGGGPAGLAGASMAYDPQAGGLILTGGGSGGGGCPNVPNTTTWVFNGSAWLVVPVTGSPGTHLFGVSAWDPSTQTFVIAGGDPNGTTTDVLAPPLTLGTTSIPTPLDLGVAAPFEAVVTGGVPQRATTWNWGDGTPDNATPNATHVYGSLGNFSIQFLAADPGGPSLYLNATVEVFDGPTPQIHVGGGAVEQGVNTTLSASSVGGYGLVTYHWDLGDGTLSNGPTVLHAFASSGTDTVTVTATDVVGRTAAVNASVDIVPALGVTLTVPARGEVGVPVRLSAQTTGGDPPVSYAWSLDDGSQGTVDSFSHNFSAAGNHTVRVSVLDGAHVYANRSATVDIALGVSLSIHGPASLAAGTSGSWTATVVGGEGPYSVSWTVPGVAGGGGTTATHAFGASGTYVVTFHVTDGLNATNSSSISVAVNSAATPFGGTVDGVPTLVIVGIVVAAAVVVAVLGLVLRRRGPRDGGTA